MPFLRLITPRLPIPVQYLPMQRMLSFQPYALFEPRHTLFAHPCAVPAKLEKAVLLALCPF